MTHTAEPCATQVARGFLDALNTGDPDRIAAWVTEDFHNEKAAVLGTGLHGRKAYRARLPEFLARFTELHYEIEELLVQENRAAVAYRMRCTYRTPQGGSVPVSIRGMFRLAMRDGLVAHRVDYWDGEDFRRQVRETP
ncbi:nuclear transport factor 2 family protein [Streptosporangium sp. NPDC051022]|uniref:nuclear transport factor 2 family protein n=1 Tax=Streptosporangium sp. NPDC051022 TaxID=3155752 RepID=UPI0034199FD9